jgi:hypothetical protein
VVVLAEQLVVREQAVYSLVIRQLLLEQLTQLLLAVVEQGLVLPPLDQTVKIVLGLDRRQLVVVEVQHQTHQQMLVLVVQVVVVQVMRAGEAVLRALEQQGREIMVQPRHGKAVAVVAVQGLLVLAQLAE